jgi:hypothetical protein
MECLSLASHLESPIAIDRIQALNPKDYEVVILPLHSIRTQCYKTFYICNL